MPNPWFRMYTEFAHDPKVQMMPEPMQRRLVMLFCLRGEETLETLHETELAFHLRISETELAETKALFIQKGFIDSHWNVENWHKRQFVSDSSTDRVRRYRQGKKQSETLHGTDETLLETPEAVTVTVQNRTEAEQIQSKEEPSEANASSPRRDADGEQKPEPDGLKEHAPFPEGLSELQYASGIFEHCSIVDTFRLRDVASKAIVILARMENLPLFRGAELMEKRITAAQARGDTTNTFWFEDAKYKQPNGGTHAGNRSQQRTNGNLAALAAVRAERRDRELTRDPGGSTSGFDQPRNIETLLLPTGEVPR